MSFMTSVSASTRTHSVLYNAMTDAARALAKESPTVPIEASAPALASRSV